MSINLSELTIAKAHRHLVNGDFSARELAESYLKNISEKNPEINAYLETFDTVLEQAREADKRIKTKKEVHSLTGIPLAMKDNILIKGYRCGAASKILEGYRATYDSTVAKKLKEAGAVFLGRTNMDEFAMGSSTENSAYGPTKNPHDLSRVPGGSSGGSAAAVAGGMALAALGSDTGGSVRQPASFCGIVGMKPTYGAVSRHGLIAMGSSLDQIGPLTKTVEDAEIIFNMIKGRDSLDSTSREFSTKVFSKKKLCIGVLKHAFERNATQGITPDVFDNFNKTIETFYELGFDVEQKVIDAETASGIVPFAHSLPAYYVIMPAEVSSNLARFDGVRYGKHAKGVTLFEDYAKTRGAGFGPEVRRRIMLGTYVLSAGYYDAYYNKANIVRTAIKQAFEYIWNQGVDIILTPTTPSPAFKLKEKTSDPLQMYRADIFTVTANIAGIPAISIPSGYATVDGKQLPLGIQIMAPHGREDILFSLGKHFESTQRNSNVPNS